MLDTQAFLWHADGNSQMSAMATALLADPANELYLSMASVWEIAIKVGLGTSLSFLWLSQKWPDASISAGRGDKNLARESSKLCN
jgi:PIN domain nuclease of toxin-antitoxin system